MHIDVNTKTRNIKAIVNFIPNILFFHGTQTGFFSVQLASERIKNEPLKYDKSVCHFIWIVVPYVIIYSLKILTLLKLPDSETLCGIFFRKIIQHITHPQCKNVSCILIIQLQLDVDNSLLLFTHLQLIQIHIVHLASTLGCRKIHMSLCFHCLTFTYTVYKWKSMEWKM